MLDKHEFMDSVATENNLSRVSMIGIKMKKPNRRRFDKLVTIYAVEQHH